MVTRVAAILLMSVLALLPGTAKPDASPMSGYLQVVAHPDDDILFMNPDLAQSIRTHEAVTSVYLTAGESDVRPAAQYAAQRQAGTRASFARMAGVPDVWTATVLDVGGGRTAELFALRARPSVRLVFLNLPDDNSADPETGKHALTRLWADQDADLRVGTLLPAGSALPGTSTYDREEIIATLAYLYAKFDPSVVRMHDPEPDLRYQTHWVHRDHSDHVMTAHFAEEAVRWSAPRRDTIRVRYYRGYNIADMPANLAPSVVADKQDTFRRYAAHDFMVSMDDPYAKWLRGMRYRWNRGDGWVAIDHHGRLNAAYISAGRLHVGQRYRRRFNWSVVDTPGFVPSGGGPVLVRDRAGVLSIVLRSRGEHDIFVLRQRIDGTWQPDWTNLGSPNSGDAVVTQPGQPAVAAAATDGLVMAAKNSRGGISVLIEGAGVGWCDIGGAHVDGGVSVVPGLGGLHVFASAADGLLHWRQVDSDRFEREVLPHHPGGQVVAARDEGGNAYTAFRASGSGRLIVLSERADWSPIAELEISGSAAPALTIGRDGVPQLAARDAGGSLVLFELPPASPVRRHVVDRRVISGPAFTEDGSFLVADRLDGGTAVYPVATS